MSFSAAKINQKQIKENFKSIKETNFALIQNDNILVIFLCLQAKLQLIQDDRALLLCTSN